jgi:adenosine deaminase/adenosine deaminase CECR1
VVAFHQAGVPIVLSTDDPGVLRNSLTDEFVLLAERYPELSYSDIKQISFNAIKYSHIEEAVVKEKLRGLLEARFKEFEKMW